jgi:hypothetical protein
LPEEKFAKRDRKPTKTGPRNLPRIRHGFATDSPRGKRNAGLAKTHYSPRICPKFATNLPQIRHESAPNSPRIRHESATDSPRICPGFATNLPRIRHARNVMQALLKRIIRHESPPDSPRICPKFATNPPRICHESPTNLPRIPHESAPDSPRIRHEFAKITIAIYINTLLLKYYIFLKYHTVP